MFVLIYSRGLNNSQQRHYKFKQQPAFSIIVPINTQRGRCQKRIIIAGRSMEIVEENKKKIVNQRGKEL
ncbi:hypothetical protein A4D02_03770 [Niastella koreensis]|uniref:Uncharacterized protein n=1 Tax=Niastella koreensis TaxID=354356 RepID=A0ABX3P5K0_9BACT|nr:hypothetical protein A4D02_03770 [Niastella koreensis]